MVVSRKKGMKVLKGSTMGLELRKEISQSLSLYGMLGQALEEHHWACPGSAAFRAGLIVVINDSIG